jgi:hypothetical protein
VPAVERAVFAPHANLDHFGHLLAEFTARIGPLLAHPDGLDGVGGLLGIDPSRIVHAVVGTEPVRIRFGVDAALGARRAGRRSPTPAPSPVVSEARCVSSWPSATGSAAAGCSRSVRPVTWRTGTHRHRPRDNAFRAAWSPASSRRIAKGNSSGSSSRPRN